ncbi:4-hydroxy-tetrahydrodipicolinate synthase, chloroplastic-like protein [Tanacetum coccineum]
MELHNSVVVSDGDDKKISLWRKTGQSTGTNPAVGTDSGGDNIENGSARWTPLCVAIIPNFHIPMRGYEVKIKSIKTPYLPDGRFDLEAYDSLVNMQIEDGTDGVIVGGTLKFGSLDLDVATRPQNAEGCLQRHRPLMICDAENQCTKRLDWTLLFWLDMSRKVVFLNIGLPKVQRYR